MSIFFHHHQQLDQMDCGPACLRMVARHYGKHYTAQTLREKCQISRDGVSMLGIAEAAEALGFKTVGVKVAIDTLSEEVPLPCILHWEQNHFVVLYKVSDDSWSLGRNFLARIWGGRGTPQPLSASAKGIDNLSADDEDGYNPVRNSGIGRKKYFHVADPAGGLIKYDQHDFLAKWLSSYNKEGKEGIALLVEPTSRFFEEDDEKKQEGLNLSQLVVYLWQFRSLIAQLALGTIIGSAISLVLPFLTQAMVDVGIGTANLSLIYLILIAQSVLLFSTVTVDFLRSWIFLHISTRLNLTIVSQFFAKLMRLPVSYFDVKHFGDIMQRIGDHSRIESFLTGQSLAVIFSLFNFVVFGVVLAYYSTFIFSVTIAFSILYVIWILLFLRQRKIMDRKRFELSSRNQSQVVQLIQGMQEIKLADAEVYKRWEWERNQAKLFKLSVKGLTLSQIQQGGALLINQSKNILITFLAAKAVIEGKLSLGEMMSVQYMLGQFNAPIEQMISFVQSWQDAQISLERLNEVHGLADEEVNSTAVRKDWNKDQDLFIENLTYSYPGAGNEPVLTDINLIIPFGKTTAIVGTSGSGKTTLLKLLLRFYEPQRGSIYLRKSSGIELANPILKWRSTDGEEYYQKLPLSSLSHKAWRRGCGVVMQDGFLFSDTIARNIAVGAEVIDQEKLFNAAQIANIHHFIDSLPLGYHTKIGAEGNGISQGQKQRILIARAVYKDPQLLLFDEATNSLDANNEAAIVSNLRQFYLGRTVVIVAHRLSTVRDADKIVVMEKGRIVEQGDHPTLIRLKGKYYELVSNQLELSVD